MNEWAIEIPVSQKITITDIEYWVAGTKDGPVTLRVSVFDDGGDVPGNNLIFSGSFAPETKVQWQGISSLSVPLDPKEYWFSIDNISEPLPYDEDTFFVPGASLQAGVPNPGENFAFRRNKYQDPLRPSRVIDFGIRVQGEYPQAAVTPIPEPMTLILFGGGVVGAIVARRRKK